MNSERAWVSALTGTVLASAGALAYAVRAPSCAWLAPSFARGPFNKRAMALTFDDGPSESTSRLLEMLARYQIPATFFQCGENVRRLPAVCQEVAAAGHEIGNHTFSHPLLALKSSNFIYQELRRAQEVIQHAAGVRPRYFRAPFGARWFGLRSAQAALSLRGAMWSTIALDWKLPASAVVARLLHGATPGAILCLHDGRVLQRRPDIGVTLQAVSEFLPRAIDRGFVFETISDLVG